MSRLVYLSRVDIRPIQDRSTGSLTLRYVGRKLRFFDRMYGYPDGTFFAVVLAEVPMPESLTTLASAVGVSLDTMPLAAELRRAIAEVLAAEATMDAPDYLSMISEPRTAWIEGDARELEHRSLVAENKVRELSRLIENNLRRRMTMHAAPPQIRTYDPMPPAGFVSRVQEPPPVVAAPAQLPEVVEIEEEEAGSEVDSPAETSESTGKRVLAAVKVAREQELPQRLPGGARKSLSRLPAGIYVSHGPTCERKNDICAAMVAGAEGGKRGGEVAVIDWDGEWPVVARRYGAYGRIVYRVEEALRRHGISTGEAA